MAEIIVLGAGTGGVPAAYELKGALGRDHKVTLVNASSRFQFVPSNPWVAVGWRRREDTSLELGPYLEKRGIEFVPQTATRIAAGEKCARARRRHRRSYDFLVITTGPKLAFDEIPGFGRDVGYTQSICTLEHATEAYRHYEEFLENPGHIVVGAVQGASCFGPAYEFAMILDADLRRRKLRHKVPMTFVTSEPYIGHMGLAGVGDSKGLMESEFRQRHIQWITNAAVRQARGRQGIRDRARCARASHEDARARVEVHDAAAGVQGRRRGRRRRGPVQPARLRDRRRASAQPEVPEHLCGRRRHRDPADREDARADRRAEDRAT